MSTRISFEEILPLIKEARDTLVLLHRNPDADAVGSAYAMKKILEALGSRAFCVCADEIPDRLRFLLYGEQESLLPDAIPADMAVERVVSVDSASPAQLSSLYPTFEGRIDLMIDHHGSGEAYAKHAYVRSDAAATGEIMFDLVKALTETGKMTASKELLSAIYAAISADTGCFRYSNARASTHLRAAELTESGIDTAEINRLLFDCKSMEQLRAEAAGVSRLELYEDGRVAIITFPYALRESMGLTDAHLGTLIDVARTVAGVQVAICIRQPSPKGHFRISARSASRFNVAALCERFEGGGHVKAAGGTVYASSIEEARDRILEAIDRAELDEI